VRLCAGFARNMAYYRAAHDRLTRITIDGNFIDMAVIEWCKPPRGPETASIFGEKLSRSLLVSR
jgi:hypothetical protein